MRRWNLQQSAILAISPRGCTNMRAVPQALREPHDVDLGSLQWITEIVSTAQSLIQVKASLHPVYVKVLAVFISTRLCLLRDGIPCFTKDGNKLWLLGS